MKGLSFIRTPLKIASLATRRVSLSVSTFRYLEPRRRSSGLGPVGRGLASVVTNGKTELNFKRLQGSAQRSFPVCDSSSAFTTISPTNNGDSNFRKDLRRLSSHRTTLSSARTLTASSAAGTKGRSEFLAIR